MFVQTPPKQEPSEIVFPRSSQVKMTGGASPGPSPNPDSKIPEGRTTNGQRRVRTGLPMHDVSENSSLQLKQSFPLPTSFCASSRL